MQVPVGPPYIDNTPNVNECDIINCKQSPWGCPRVQKLALTHTYPRTEGITYAVASSEPIGRGKKRICKAKARSYRLILNAI